MKHFKGHVKLKKVDAAMNAIEKYENQVLKNLLVLKEHNQPIVLFGAGLAGILAKKVFDHYGITISCYADNNPQKHQTLVEGIQVLSSEELKIEYPDATIAICIQNNLVGQKIMAQLTGLNYQSFIPFEGLRYLFIKNKLYNTVSVDVAALSIAYTDMRTLPEHDEELILSIIEVPITEKCSLRCKDCSNLLQYYSQPKNYPKDNIIESVKKLAASVSAIERLSLLGGEPLLHPDLSEIVTEILKIPNIYQISLITNGTVVPAGPVLEKLASGSVLILMSDYGDLSHKKEKLQKACSENGVFCKIEPKNEEWEDCSTLKKFNHIETKTMQMFKECRLKDVIHTVLNGKYHLCAHSAHGTNLGAIPQVERDYINLLDDSLSPEQTGEALRKLINDTKVLISCGFCSGPHISDKLPKIPPAIQIKEPLLYDKHLG